MDRLILDTGVLVAAVRGRATVPDDADVAIPAIVIAEYLAGVHLDQDAGRQAAQRAFLDEVLAVIPVHAYDRSVAEHHAALLAYTARQGQRRGAHDLIVAATGRATGRTILTTDRHARFGELPDVNARTIT
ncbi:PIN domain-containing protein [Mycobacterium sp.]|uniref:PIN domain-containing protein n=1 Tax=Mycobacterium sp. TaxID=1785 RepID=UPI003F98E3FD